MSQAVEAECQTEGTGGKEGTKGFDDFNIMPMILMITMRLMMVKEEGERKA